MVTLELTSPGRRERSKVACRARIIKAAIRLFGERSIEKVTVDEIAYAADTGKGTIYNYFRTKEEIVVAFMADVERTVVDELRRLDLANRPVADALTEFVRLQFSLKVPHYPFVRVFFGQMFTQTHAFLPHMAEIHALARTTTETLFEELQRRGAIRHDIDVPGLAAVFINMHLGLSALWAIEGPPFRMTNDLLEREIRLFCEGIEPRIS